MKQESGAEKRDHAAEKKARQEQERQVAAEAEKDAQQRAHERLTWIKQESEAEKRDHGAEKKARQDQERQERRAAAEAEKEGQQRAHERLNWIKQESGARSATTRPRRRRGRVRSAAWPPKLSERRSSAGTSV